MFSADDWVTWHAQRLFIKIIAENHVAIEGYVGNEGYHHSTRERNAQNDFHGQSSAAPY